MTAPIWAVMTNIAAEVSIKICRWYLTLTLTLYQPLPLVILLCQPEVGSAQQYSWNAVVSSSVRPMPSLNLRGHVIEGQ